MNKERIKKQRMNKEKMNKRRINKEKTNTRKMNKEKKNKGRVSNKRMRKLAPISPDSPYLFVSASRLQKHCRSTGFASFEHPSLLVSLSGVQSSIDIKVDLLSTRLT